MVLRIYPVSKSNFMKYSLLRKIFSSFLNCFVSWNMKLITVLPSVYSSLEVTVFNKSEQEV